MLTKQYHEHLGAKDAGSLFVGYEYDVADASAIYTKGMRLKSLIPPYSPLSLRANENFA